MLQMMRRRRNSRSRPKYLNWRECDRRRNRLSQQECKFWIKEPCQCTRPRTYSKQTSQPKTKRVFIINIEIAKVLPPLTKLLFSLFSKIGWCPSKTTSIRSSKGTKARLRICTFSNLILATAKIKTSRFLELVKTFIIRNLGLRKLGKIGRNGFVLLRRHSIILIRLKFKMRVKLVNQNVKRNNNTRNLSIKL